MPSVDEVKGFWESNPLWSGESRHEMGSRAYFEEHRTTVINDCFGGRFDPRTLPGSTSARVLDLGCGPGFWTVEFGLKGMTDLTAADLTEAALELARKRCQLYGINAKFSQQNAEQMTFSGGSFDHVNCQGVIHHTPDTEACVREIARVLVPGGTASVSVYYRNVFLRIWPLLGWLGKLAYLFGSKLSGRGREKIYATTDANEIVRLYDGADNPVGKAYSRKEFLAMLEPYFVVEETYLHFFPARTLPFKLPASIHRWLDRHAGFLIYATLRKR